MLFVLLYHGINDSQYSNSYTMLKKHLHFIKDHYPIVMPGDFLPKGDCVCLTFDDCCFDIFHSVYPILQELNLKAILAAPIGLIQETTTDTASKRLSAVKNFHENQTFTKKNSPFCTWQEIQEMTQSHCILASHGFSHQNLTKKNMDLNEEIVLSKNIGEKIIHKPIQSFVYPFGAFNQEIHAKVKEEYLYIFRIGSALNFSFHPKEKLLYRIPCDQLKSIDAPFRMIQRLQTQTKTFWNFLRKK